VVRIFKPKNAGTENSEILNIKMSTKELMIAGLINGRIILNITLRKVVVINPLSSNSELIFEKALPIISIAKGVKMIVKTNITAK
jgi:hypothetical protein